MKILNRSQIEQLLSFPNAIDAIEEGFAAYSRGETVIPPIGILHFENPPGDVHIKYGYANQGKYYVVKIASGFYENNQLGLPTGNGLMLLFDKQKGELVCILLDEGYLTDVRTAAAGCICAKYLAPSQLLCIGIIGTGTQAFHQLNLLSYATSCRKVLIWGRDATKAWKLKEDPLLKLWKMEVAQDLDQLTSQCNLIVTTTSAKSALLFASQIRPGTHITAVGAGDKGQQELDPELFVKADKVVVDSRSQCIELGDTSHPFKQGLIAAEQLIELGEIIMDPTLGRTSQTQITIADLTGVAIQDLQIATSVFEAMARSPIALLQPFE